MATSNTKTPGINRSDAIAKNNIYSPKTFDFEKYRVDSLSYPNDLMGNMSQYGFNYVIFYINVSEDSKMIKNKEAQTVDIEDNERVKKSLAGENYTKLQVIGTQAVAGVLASTALGGAVGLQGAGLAGTAAVTAGTSIAALQTSGSTFSRPQRRLKSAIALHVPNQLNIRYGMGWSEEETFGLQAMLAGGSELAGAAGKLGTLSNGSSENFGNVGSIISAATMRSLPGGNAVSSLSGLAPNPKKEQIFTGVDFRTFTFDYDFAPRSSSEAKNVLNIIKAFKYHMHPEYKDATSFLFVYPSEFDIVYYHGTSENMNIHRHTSCALTELTVNYTPNGLFNTFSDGMPTHIRVQMTFRELTILTKELVQEGL